MARLQLSTLILFGWLLSACSVQTPQPDSDRLFEPGSQFSAAGKLGVKTEEFAESARFFWQQDGDKYRIQLLDPFGRNVLVLSGNASAVTLKLSGEDQIFTADTPEALMQQVLGWQVPIEPASFWIQGVPQPGVPKVSLDENRFTQSGWTVEVSDRAFLSGQQDAPRRVQLSRDALSLTLIFSAWN